MQVYKNLDNLSDCTAGERKQAHQLIQQFEAVRTDANATSNLFDSIPIDDRLKFSKVVVKVIKDWDRLSFSHLYKECCWHINRNQGDVVIPIVSILNKLNSNVCSIEYACKIDLEHIDELYKNQDVQGLKELLYYSEGCTSCDFNQEYKTIAEDKIKRYLNRLNSITQITSATSTETEIQPKQEDKPQCARSKKRLESISEETAINYDSDLAMVSVLLHHFITKDTNGITKWKDSAKLYAYLAVKIKQRRGYKGIYWDSFTRILPLVKDVSKDTLKRYASSFSTGKQDPPAGYKIVDNAVNSLL